MLIEGSNKIVVGSPIVQRRFILDIYQTPTTLIYYVYAWVYNSLQGDYNHSFLYLIFASKCKSDQFGFAFCRCKSFPIQ